MANTMQTRTASTSSDQKSATLYSAESTTDLVELNRQANPEYLPMNVFIDRFTMKEHFQALADR